MINHIHFKMRNFIFIILLSVVCSCSQQNNDDIVVDFNVQNMTYSKIAIVVSPERIWINTEKPAVHYRGI